MTDTSLKETPPLRLHASVTLQDIAQRCGVTKMTVSRILRGERPQSKKAAEILAVAQAMGYDPDIHDSARRLALRKGGKRLLAQTLGCLMPTDFFTATFFSELYRGILKGASEYDYSLTTVQVDPEKPRKRHLLPPSFRRGEVDGVVAYGRNRMLRPVMQQLYDERSYNEFPIVTFLSPLNDFPSVNADEYLGAYQAATHLLELGHRHLLLFVYWLYNEQRDIIPSIRVTATRDAMRAYGLESEVHLHLFPYMQGTLNPMKVRTELSALPENSRRLNYAHYPFLEFLRLHPEVTAILALNDANALHSWYLLHRAGYRIPDDISIIGFDDTDPMLNVYGRNMLSTVHVPLIDIGYQAVRSCLDQVTGIRLNDEHLLLPTSFVNRASTAPATPRAC